MEFGSGGASHCIHRRHNPTLSELQGAMSALHRSTCHAGGPPGGWKERLLARSPRWRNYRCRRPCRYGKSSVRLNKAGGQEHFGDQACALHVRYSSCRSYISGVNKGPLESRTFQIVFIAWRPGLLLQTHLRYRLGESLLGQAATRNRCNGLGTRFLHSGRKYFVTIQVGVKNRSNKDHILPDSARACKLTCCRFVKQIVAFAAMIPSPCSFTPLQRSFNHCCTVYE
jgi:hypothetical protein